MNSARPRPLAVAANRAELATALQAVAPTGQSTANPCESMRAVVMTMGALHAGHESLITTAREVVGTRGQVIVTIFVNPLQFGANEDLASYPSMLEADLARCRRLGVDLVFVPTRAQMYPAGDPKVVVDAGVLGGILEGAARPTHFGGVLTVVTKLIGLTGPHYAIFGEKDYQQLVLIRQLVRDLELPVEVIGAPIVRDADGLALSSRNAYFSSVERRLALAVPGSVQAGVAAARAGANAAEVVATAQATLTAFQPDGVVRPDYVVVTDTQLGPAPVAGPARLLIAAHVGRVRLLDNAPIELADPAESTRPDSAAAR